MLVLTRKVGEQICVPQLDVVITVFAVYGRRVRLGIAAPEKIAVVRNELRQSVPKPGDSHSLVRPGTSDESTEIFP